VVNKLAADGGMTLVSSRGRSEDGNFLRQTATFITLVIVVVE